MVRFEPHSLINRIFYFTISNNCSTVSLHVYAISLIRLFAIVPVLYNKRYTKKDRNRTFSNSG